MKRSSAWMVAGLFGLLIAALVYSGLKYREAEAHAQRAADQARQVQSIAQEIVQLTDRPAVAMTQTEEVRQLSGLIESSAIACGIEKQHIDSIDAQDARRIGKTPYYRLPTRVSLVDVELQELVALLTKMAEGDHIRIDDCRIAAPHAEVVGRTWNAEFTLSYLIYDPVQDTVQR